MIHALAATNTVNNSLHFNFQFRRSQNRNMLPYNFVGRVPIDLFGASIPADDYTVQRLTQNRIIRSLDDRRQIIFCFFAGFAVGHVEGGAYVTQQLSVGTKSRGSCIVDPTKLAVGSANSELQYERFSLFISSGIGIHASLNVVVVDNF